MAINNETLISELSQNGVVIIAGVNNPKSYVVAMENVTSSEEILTSIIESHILSEYPVKKDYYQNR